MRPSLLVGLDNEQSLHHFLTKSPWDAQELRKRRLAIILKILQGRSIILIIDETGDKKKGKSTDYVKRQYIGNIGKLETGIVAVTAYGYLEGITFPLTFEVFKPKERLKDFDLYKTKPQIAGEMIEELQQFGFKFKLVLADSLYGESDVNCVNVLYKLNLNYLLAIRSNHAVWLPKEQKVRWNKWQKFERVFEDGRTEIRYIREIIFGKRRQQQFWQITTNIDTLPENSTWYVMSNIPGVKYHEIGNLYGLRTWVGNEPEFDSCSQARPHSAVEYGLKQSRGRRPAACELECIQARSAGKNELGWADFRVTHYSQIEKWWEIVMSAYLLVNLHSHRLNQTLSSVPKKFQEPELWDFNEGWKNLRLGSSFNDSALSLLQFHQALVKGFSDSSIISGIS